MNKEKRGAVFWILMIFLIAGSLISASTFLDLPVQRTKSYHIGVLMINDSRNEKLKGLQEELNELGYQEGVNVTYQLANAEGSLSDLQKLTARLIKDKPDVLVAAGMIEAETLKRMTQQMNPKLPVVFMGVLSPVSNGLVANNISPGANLTGLDNYHLELMPKRLELMHDLLPGVHEVAVLGDTRLSFVGQTERDLLSVAGKLSLKLGFYTVSSSVDVRRVFPQLLAAKTEAVMILPGFFLETSTPQIVQMAMEKHLPVFGVYPSDTDEGCIASYGTSFREQGRESAQIVYKVLNGYPPGKIPIEIPDVINFSVNLKTASALGVKLPSSIVSYADQVIRP